MSMLFAPVSILPQMLQAVQPKLVQYCKHQCTHESNYARKIDWVHLVEGLRLG